MQPDAPENVAKIIRTEKCLQAIYQQVQTGQQEFLGGKTMLQIGYEHMYICSHFKSGTFEKGSCSSGTHNSCYILTAQSGQAGNEIDTAKQLQLQSRKKYS